ncbi:MAG: hypothetical protein C7K11_02445 [Candidatus Amulumruptor caecigallinarius]|nr:MAG: hypothetical protein C7K11_02445 [Candidatus Amulumruptor caecigallinarius]
MLFSLTSVILPDGLAEIPTAMFLGCSSLTSVELPDGITTIEQELFTGCVSLKSIKIPLSVTLIDDSAFSSSGLESVVIPDNIKRISYGVFHNCVNLKEIVLGKSLECINTRALSGCTSLVSITSLNLDVPTCQTYVFENVNKFQCKVYVPEGSVDAYRAAEGWKEFLFIEPISESGVDEMGADADGVTAVEYYDLQGVRLDAPTKGVNIVVYSDGSRRKVVL